MGAECARRSANVQCVTLNATLGVKGAAVGNDEGSSVQHRAQQKKCHLFKEKCNMSPPISVRKMSAQRRAIERCKRRIS